MEEANNRIELQVCNDSVDSTMSDSNQNLIDDETTINEEHSEAESRQMAAHEARGKSKVKWFILMDIFVAWTSAYFLTFCVSPLETTLLDELNWSSSQYSYIVATTFFGAIVGPFLLPFFDRHKKSVNICSIRNNQVLLIVGQGSFAILLQIYRTQQLAGYYALILISRFVIGLGMGLTDAMCQGTINYWFGASEHINEAFGILCIGIEIGVLTSRTAFRPFYQLFNGEDHDKAIAIPFLLALIVPALSIIVSIVVQRRVQRAKKRFPNLFVDNASDSEESMLSGSKSVIQQIKGLSGTIWLVIGVVVLVNVVINVLYSCFVDPLHESFGFTEYDADLVLSLCAVSIIVFAFPAAFAMDYFGGPIYWLLFAATSMTSSMGLLAVTAMMEANGSMHANMKAYGIASICGFSILLPFATVIFALQGIVSPPEQSQLIASISTVLWWTLSIIVTNAFGWIRDATGHYWIALQIMFGVCGLIFLFGVALLIVDKKANGPLSKCTDRTKHGDDQSLAEALIVNE